MSNTYGYVRVSSQDQNEDRQLIALREKLVDPKQSLVKKRKLIGGGGIACHIDRAAAGKGDLVWNMGHGNNEQISIGTYNERINAICSE